MARLKSTPRASSQRTRRYRFRPGTVALREIRRYQLNTDLLIPKAPFGRLVRETIWSFRYGLRLQANAIRALQEATEKHVVDMLSNAQQCANHARRVTIMPSDIKLANDLRDA